MTCLWPQGDRVTLSNGKNTFETKASIFSTWSDEWLCISCFIIQIRLSIQCCKNSAFYTLINPCFRGRCEFLRAPISSSFHEGDFRARASSPRIHWNLGRHNCVRRFQNCWWFEFCHSLKALTWNLTMLLCTKKDQRGQTLQKLVGWQVQKNCLWENETD